MHKKICIKKFINLDFYTLCIILYISKMKENNTTAKLVEEEINNTLS